MLDARVENNKLNKNILNIALFTVLFLTKNI